MLLLGTHVFNPLQTVNFKPLIFTLQTPKPPTNPLTISVRSRAGFKTESPLKMSTLSEVISNRSEHAQIKVCYISLRRQPDKPPDQPNAGIMGWRGNKPVLSA
jgi:hypothetical protein